MAGISKSFNFTDTFDRISYNFEVAKVVAILVVATAHFFEGSILWVPATMGLFLFGFSSAFFTALKYQGGFSKKKFWNNKFSRLGSKLIIINVFLLILFLVEHKEGVITWQTVIHMAGFSGVLNWFDLANPSPFGRGLWFFTLLIIFYALYPALEFLNRKKLFSALLTVSFVLIASILHYSIHVGHMLWLTATGFLCGVMIAKRGEVVSIWLSGLTVIIFSIGMIIATFLMHIHYLNFYFMFIISFGIVLWLMQVELPQKLLFPFTLLSGCLLEIYIIHTYLMGEFTGYRVLDLFLSMILIVLVALVLEKWSMQAKKIPNWIGLYSQ